MSERGSFTTEYIYNDEDYKIMREALDQNRKRLCISPPATWTDGDGTVVEMPIVSGKVGELTPGWEYQTIIDCIKDVKTNFMVRIIVMCDDGDIYLLCKEPDPQGWVDYTKLKEDENEECEIEDYEVDISKHRLADGIHTKVVWKSGAVTEYNCEEENEDV